MKFSERLKAGILLDNPVFMQTIGLCPSLATTTSLSNAIGMGVAATVVLICSNVVISMLRKFIPDKIRIAAFISIIATFVTLIQMLLKAYIPSLAASLGLFLPLIVVNCIILGRAESYASKNPIIPSLFDGLGMGLGFTFGLTCIGIVREILGAGQVFGFQIMPSSYEPITIFILAPGAFIVLSMLVATRNKIMNNMEKKGKKVVKPQGGCAEGGCASCGGCASSLSSGQDKE